MSTTVNRVASPTLGVAAGYFLVTMYLIPEGHLQPGQSEEAVAMAGIICTHIIMELKGFLLWFGGLFVKKQTDV